MRHFLEERINLVKTLIKDVKGVSYADIVLILTAVLSTCASIKWPGERIDKKRFVELLVKYSPANFRTTWVSIPALIISRLLDESDTLYGKPGEQDRIFTDDEIDLELPEAKNQYPLISVKDLKKHSYASLIYTWLRCGYSHEYCPHSNITEIPASREKARVSYIGSGSMTSEVLEREVSFHLDYLIELTEFHVKNSISSSIEHPAHWWIDLG